MLTKKWGRKHMHPSTYPTLHSAFPNFLSKTYLINPFTQPRNMNTSDYSHLNFNHSFGATPLHIVTNLQNTIGKDTQGIYIKEQMWMPSLKVTKTELTCKLLWSNSNYPICSNTAIKETREMMRNLISTHRSRQHTFQSNPCNKETLFN